MLSVRAFAAVDGASDVNLVLVLSSLATLRVRAGDAGAALDPLAAAIRHCDSVGDRTSLKLPIVVLVEALFTLGRYEGRSPSTTR